MLSLLQVILLLTYSFQDQSASAQPVNTNLYRCVKCEGYDAMPGVPLLFPISRSKDYGASFELILDRLDNPSPNLWNGVFVSPADQNLVRSS